MRTISDHGTAGTDGHFHHFDGVNNRWILHAIVHKLFLRDGFGCRRLNLVLGRMFQDFPIEFFSLTFVGHLIVTLVDIVAEQTVNCKKYPRQFIDCQHIVAIEIIESENEADFKYAD